MFTTEYKDGSLLIHVTEHRWVDEEDQKLVIVWDQNAWDVVADMTITSYEIHSRERYLKRR